MITWLIIGAPSLATLYSIVSWYATNWFSKEN